VKKIKRTLLEREEKRPTFLLPSGGNQKKQTRVNWGSKEGQGEGRSERGAVDNASAKKDLQSKTRGGGKRQNEESV